MIDKFEIEANGYKYKCRRLPKEHKVIVVSSTGYSFKVEIGRASCRERV